MRLYFPQAPDDIPRGLQFQGTAEMLTKQSDIDYVISLYADRIFSREKINALINSKDRPHKFYKIKPTKFVLFDAVNFPENSRQELEM